MPGRGFHEFGGGEVPHPMPGLDCGDTDCDQDVRLARAGWPDQAAVFRRPDPLQAGEVVETSLAEWRRQRGRTRRGSWSGNAADRIRVRALDSSRAVISASTRVRRNSSGFQRCVLAVTSSSGARRRIAAIFNRFSPSFRSAANGGGLLLTAPHRRWRRSAAGSAPMASQHKGLPSWARHRDGASAAARMDRTSSARQRLNSTARCSAASSAVSPCAACRSGLPDLPSRCATPAAAAPVQNATATSPRARNRFSSAVSPAVPGVACPAGCCRSAHRRCWSHPVPPERGRRRSRR